MDRKRTTGKDIRRQNRSALLSELFFNGPLSRLELSEITGLSPATASNVTAELFGERLIVEAGQVDSDGGRPRVLLRVDPGFGQVVGVVVAETGVQVELFDLAMNKLAEVNDQPSSGGLVAAEVADLIAAGVKRVIAEAGVDPNGVLGIGIAVPGVVEQVLGEEPGAEQVHAPTIGWQSVPLSRLLRERGVDQPVFVENGAKTLGQAEMWFGGGRGTRHAVVVLLGTGVGAAVFADGAAYQGMSSSASEWGHTTIAFDGRECRCGARGCLEAYVGAEGILDRYRWAQRRSSNGHADAVTADGSADDGLFEACGVSGADDISRVEAVIHAAGRSTVAAQLIDETADLVGIGIANLINLYNPERVLVGGWTGLALGDRILPRVREAARRSALPHLFAQVSIELGTLGRGAGALGAATLPVAALLAAAADPRADRRLYGQQETSGVEVA
jgi:predicted NBD/HSP70 family sugar kinase